MKTWKRSTEVVFGVIVATAVLSPSGILQLMSQANPNFTLEQAGVSAGGGTSFGSSFSLAGVIGQSAVRPMAGGNYSLQGLSWSLVGVFETTGSPFLSVSFVETNTVLLSWPAGATNFSLQTTADLVPENWTRVTLPVSNDGQTNSVLIPISTGRWFYRLVKP